MPCRGSTNSAGFGIAWTGNRGSEGSLFGARGLVKTAGDSKGIVGGGLVSPIWCIVGCFPRGTCLGGSAGLLIGIAGGRLVLVGLIPPKNQ